jgi:cell division protein FtsB
MSEGITDYARMLVLIDDVKRLEREKNLIITCRNLEMKDLRAENARMKHEVDTLRHQLEVIHKLDPLLREAIASAVLASKEGRP